MANLAGSEDLVLLLEGLEATVAELGGSVDELEFDLLVHPRASGGEDALAENDRSLLATKDLTLEKEEVVVDNTVVREATHGSDFLLNGVLGARGVGGVVTGTDPEDLLVDFGTGVVTHLTNTADRPFDGSGVPSSDTTDLAETSVGLSLELLDTVSLDDTLGSLTLGNTDSVNALVLAEDLADGDFLLELAPGPVNLLVDVATVDLHFEDVSLLKTEVQLGGLGGADHTHDRGVAADTVEVALHGDLLIFVSVVLGGVMGEGLLLGVAPVPVEAAEDLSVELTSPDSLEGAQATGSLDVTDDTDDLHGGALNDSGGVDDIPLDDLLGTLTTLLVLNDVGHAGLVAHKGGQVHRLGRVVLGEVSYTATVVLASALGDKSKVARAGRLILAV